MISGNRPVFIASVLGASLLLAAMAAHAPDSLRAPTILVAAELVPESPPIALLDCAPVASRDSVELRFERITADPDQEEMQRLLSRGAETTVVFEWNPGTSELTYGSAPSFTPPAPRGAAASTLARASCESR